ncbi:ATP11 protein-domain-containing protein [Dactylonectria estremocensis]|uniref:ATP11 protein-domain-containing protein n=1 Tax=Dactylonectria estremocensis TaxID=1079267 RepID=A0A9P9JI70_9HYPO|nr:ATP11 protein-domain-containing protein [Dactylonectria estremocensis]
MASLRVPILRHLAVSPLRATRCVHQRRWAQVHDIRFLATTRPAQDIADKYRAKLDQKAKNEGLSSIDDLKAAYADRIEAERLKNVIEDPVIPQAPDTPVSQPNADGTPIKNTLERPKVPTGADKSAIKALDDIIDLEKSRALPDKELTAIWRLRHASSPQTLCAVVPTSAYKAMDEAARTSPQFVLPVPHPTQGAEIHFLQWTFDAASKTSTVLFTQLAEYKTRGEFAQPHTTITHHLDLADEKGLVLMQGQVVDGRGVKPEEAKWLIMCLQRFYGGWEAEGVELDGGRKERAEERTKLLQWFAAGDSRFSLEKLMEEAERMG